MQAMLLLGPSMQAMLLTCPLHQSYCYVPPMLRRYMLHIESHRPARSLRGGHRMQQLHGSCLLPRGRRAPHLKLAPRPPLRPVLPAALGLVVGGGHGGVRHSLHSVDGPVELKLQPGAGEGRQQVGRLASRDTVGSSGQLWAGGGRHTF